MVFVRFWKGVFSNGKEFAPKGNNFLPFRVDPFSEGTWCIEKQTDSHKKIVSLVNNGGKSTKCIQSP